jgi:two-component system sensor histidine kinase MprB
MSLRTSIALTAGIAVLAAVLAASLAMYFATATALRDGVDEGLARLADMAEQMANRPSVERLRLLRADTLVRGGNVGYAQPLDGQGRPLGPDARSPLAISERMSAVARGEHPAFYETVQLDSESVRVLTIPLDGGGAVALARPLDELEATLDGLRTRLAAVVLGGVLLALLLGAAVARRAAGPVHELTTLVEEVRATRDLTRRIELRPTNDDLRRLAHTFNEMLASLEQARAAQQQLVADASHELRTPLTSIRTNIEVLGLTGVLSDDDRRELLDDVAGQLREFGRLVDSLVDLARGDEPARDVVAVRLDHLVRDVAERVQMFLGRGSAEPFMLDLTPTVVHADEDRLERAVANLLDNAVKYGGGTRVTVRVADGRVEVRDHGPGIEPEHLAHVFDRFYRAPEARSAPGSGLGLSIVRQVAESHGGTATAANAPGGGMRFTLALPAVRAVAVGAGTA